MSLSPFSTSILLLYLLFISLLPILSDFFFFVLIMEITMLLFIGYMLLSFVSSYSSLMYFFLIQVLASFNILVGYALDLELLMLLAIFLNTALFPFITWFFSVAYRFPNFILFLVATVYNLPSLLLFYQFLNLTTPFLIISIILNFLVLASFIFVVSDLRFLLIVSSSASTVWFLLLLTSSSLYLLFSFFIIYSLTLFLTLSFIGPLSNFLLSTSSLTPNHRIILLLLLSNLAAFPPLPIFLFNVVILYNFLFSYHFLPFYEVLLILLLNAIIMVSYLKCYSKFFTLSYGRLCLYFRLFLSYAKTFYFQYISPLAHSPLPTLLICPVSTVLLEFDPETVVAAASSTSSHLSSFWGWLFPASTAVAVSAAPVNSFLSSLLVPLLTPLLKLCACNSYLFPAITTNKLVSVTTTMAYIVHATAYYGIAWGILDFSGSIILLDAAPVGYLNVSSFFSSQVNVTIFLPFPNSAMIEQPSHAQAVLCGFNQTCFDVNNQAFLQSTISPTELCLVSQTFNQASSFYNFTAPWQDAYASLSGGTPHHVYRPHLLASIDAASRMESTCYLYAKHLSSLPSLSSVGIFQDFPINYTFHPVAFAPYSDLHTATPLCDSLQNPLFNRSTLPSNEDLSSFYVTDKISSILQCMDFIEENRAQVNNAVLNLYGPNATPTGGYVY